MSTISLTRRLELRRHLQRVEEIASEWHRADPDSVAAPRIALFASEAQIEMLLELTPQAAGGDGERPRPAACHPATSASGLAVGSGGFTKAEQRGLWE